MNKNDEKFMQHALKLARLGGRDVAPNPMVGAVIVKNNKIIGKGCHQKFGGPHAEVNAIQSVKNKKNLIDATIYVTLEPCQHYGKTPPCVNLIEEVGITRVVCGSYDPFQSRFTIYDLRFTIEFLKGPIADECKQLNKFFFTWVTKKRPFITAKIAISADGFVAGFNSQPIRITNRQQDKKVHQLRANHQVIMVGINTILNDDPQLTVRHVTGSDPLRIILDSHLQIPLTAKVLKDQNILIATTKFADLKKIKILKKKNIAIWQSPTKTHVSLKKLFNYLANRGISSVLVEPGPILYQSLKKQQLIDELIIFTGKKKIKEGLSITP